MQGARPHSFNVRNIEDRRIIIITRLRLDHNKLNSCTIQTKTDPKTTNTSCKYCPTKTETIEHFILECNFFQKERSEMEKTLAEATDYRNYKSLPNVSKLRVILNVEVTRKAIILNYIRRTYEEKM